MNRLVVRLFLCVVVIVMVLLLLISDVMLLFFYVCSSVLLCLLMICTVWKSKRLLLFLINGFGWFKLVGWVGCILI